MQNTVLLAVFVIVGLIGVISGVRLYKDGEVWWKKGTILALVALFYAGLSCVIFSQGALDAHTIVGMFVFATLMCVLAIAIIVTIISFLLQVIRWRSF